MHNQSYESHSHQKNHDTDLDWRSQVATSSYINLITLIFNTLGKELGVHLGKTISTEVCIESAILICVS